MISIEKYLELNNKPLKAHKRNSNSIYACSRLVKLLHRFPQRPCALLSEGFGIEQCDSQ